MNQQVKIAVDVKQLMDALQSQSKVRTHQREMSTRYSSVVAKRKNMEAKIQRLMEDLTQGIIDKDEFKYIKAKYDQEYERLLDEETKASADMQALDGAIGSTKKWLDAIRKYQDLPELNREVMDLLVQEIRVTKTRQIKVVLNYADPYQPLNQYLQEIEVKRDALQ